MSTPSKPVVALALSPQMAKAMFRPADLDRLRAAAEVIGPFEKTDYPAALRAATVAIGGWGSPKFDAALLAAAPILKLLAYSAGSVKGVVTEDLYERGVRVSTAAGMNAVPVAHYTVAMMVAMLKQIPWIATSFAAADRDEIGRRWPHIRELQDTTVGLIGASRVGREVIKLLKAYPGVQVKLHDPYVTESQAADMGVQLTTLDDVCRCEVVSLHAPSSPKPNT